MRNCIVCYKPTGSEFYALLKGRMESDKFKPSDDAGVICSECFDCLGDESPREVIEYVREITVGSITIIE